MALDGGIPYKDGAVQAEVSPEIQPEPAPRTQGFDRPWPCSTDGKKASPLEDDGDENFERPGWRYHSLHVIWFMLVWSLVCGAVAINHVAGYICLLALDFLILFAGIARLGPATERQRKCAERHHLLTGRVLYRSVYYFSPLPSLIMLGAFGCVGFWLTWRRFGAVMVEPPPGELDDFRPFALMLWFAIFAVFGVIMTFFILLGNVFVGLVKHYNWRSFNEFDPAVGPEIPPIRVPAFPMIVDCLVPHYMTILFGVIVVIGKFYSHWYLLVGIGWTISYILVWWTTSHVTKECERLKLYCDWHEKFKPDEVIDPNILTLTRERKEVESKYMRSLLFFAIMMFFGIWPVLRWSDNNTAIESISWWWLYPGIIMVAGNYLVYRLWRQELWELPSSRFPIER